MKSNPQTRKHLRGQLKVAIEAHEKALKRFKAIVRDVPGVLPPPEGSERILKAARELKGTHRALVLLLTQLNKTGPR